MTEVVKFDYPRPRPKRIAAPDAHLSGYERTLLLLFGSRVEKRANMLEGAPEKLTSEIVRFLEENGIIVT
jgi:hypothetical protein